MSKVFTYTILSVGLLLVLNSMGIPTAASSILSWFGLADASQSIDTSLFFVAILGIFASTATIGIIIGAITRASPESYIIAAFCGGLVALVGTFTSVINYASASTGNDWSSTIILVILAPVAIGYGIALINYWRISD